MIKNYFIVAFRNLKRNKLFSPSSILAAWPLALAAFWMITLYVAHEMSYDRYHMPSAGRIYRVVQHASWNGGKF